DIDGIRLERRPGAVHGERFDLVEQRDRGTSTRREIGESAVEEAGDAALALAEHLAGGRMRVDLDEEKACPEGTRGLIRESPGERRLPCTGRAREDDQPVYREAHGVHARAMPQREQREVEQPVL